MGTPKLPQVNQPREISNKIIMLPLLLIFFLFIFYFLFSLVSTNNNSGELYPKKVTLGLVRWPGYLPLYVAAKKGYFKKYGVDLEIKTYDNNLAMVEDFREERIQALSNTSFDFIEQKVVDGLDQKAVLAIDRSLGADAIIANQNISYIEQLKGKKVAFEYKTLEEFLLRFVLKKAGLTIDDITPVDLTPALAAQALVDGKVDAAVTYEPSLSKAVDTGSAKVIYSTQQDPGIIVDLLNFRSDFVTKYPQTVKGIIFAYFDGFKYYQDHPDDSYAITKEYLDGASINVEKELKGIQLLNLLENEVILTGKEGNQSLRENFRLVLDFMLRERGILFLQIKPESLIESKFVEELYRAGIGNK